jgi:hypothetical protein
MDPYRLKSLVFYAVAALLGAAGMALLGINAVLAVGVTVAIAAVADRFINREAEPDERMRSFAVYLVGAVAGLLLILVFGTRLGSLSFITPVVGFGVAALFDYFVPPAGYQPKDPHRYGESPPVTVR